MRQLTCLALVVLGMTGTHPAAADARAELERLFADERAFTWREDPLAATNDGMHDYDDRLPAVTPAASAWARYIASPSFIES